MPNVNSTPNINILLREARESRGISIKEAAKALKLRERHIQMLEGGEFNQLSKEIYLKGFIKTYTGWLNIDGVDVDLHIDKQQKKIISQRNNQVPLMAMGFSYLGGLGGFVRRRPGVNVFIFSFLLTVTFYIFWYHNHKTAAGVDILSSISATVPEGVAEDVVEAHKYSNILDEYKGKDIVLFPHSEVEVKITNTESGEENINKLIDGDLFFLKVEDFLTISTSMPQSIEVFIDDNGEQIPVGTLDVILTDANEKKEGQPQTTLPEGELSEEAPAESNGDN